MLRASACPCMRMKDASIPVRLVALVQHLATTPALRAITGLVQGTRPALIVPAAASALVGTVVALLVPLPFWWWMMLAAGVSLLGLVHGRRGCPPAAVLCLLAISLTMAGHARWRLEHDRRARGALTGLAGRLVEAQVRVGQWPMARITALAGAGPTNGLVRLKHRPLPSGALITGPGLLLEGPRGGMQLRLSADASVHQPPETPLLALIKLIRKEGRGRLVEPPSPRGAPRALVEASVLGRRGPAFHRLYRPFLDTGTAHLLAVSGLHLALLAGLGLWARRLVGGPPWMDALVLLMTAAMMLLLVDVRPPLARSAVMAIVLAIGPMLHRRLAGGTALSAAVIVALLIDPLVVVRPGPQLSFTVVAALVWVLPVVERRAQADLRASGPWRRAWRAGWIAWAVSTPIVMLHFGRAGPLAVPAAMAMVPALTVLLAAGWVRILSPPSLLDVLTGGVMDVAARAMLWAVDALMIVPGAALSTSPAPLWWVVLAEVCVLWVCLRPGRWAWALTACCGLVLVVL